MADLFLSHVEEDSFAVKELGDALEAEGYSTWDYKKDARPAIDHQTQTRTAIEQAAAFVLFVSPRSLDQPQHVRREVVRAAQLDKPFIPLLLDVPYREFAEREPTWEDAIAGAVATSIPPEGPALIAPEIAASLKRMGIPPSIPTAVREAPPGAAGEAERAEPEAQAALNVALSYLVEDAPIAAELADALESEGYSIRHDERGLRRGKAPAESLAEGDVEAPAAGAEGSPVLKLTNMVIQRALEESAVEIHFEPTEGDVRILFRVDGDLGEVMRAPKRLHGGLISRLKIMADLNIADRDALQEGRVEFTAGGRAVSLRVTTTPGAFGEKAIVRIQEGEAAQIDAEQAKAVIVLVRRDWSGSPHPPEAFQKAYSRGTPLLLVQVDASEEAAGADPLSEVAPEGSTLVEMPGGVTRGFVSTLVEKLREMGIAPRDGKLRIQLVLGDITDQKVDAVVNAANPTLMGGAGVDGAIHDKGGAQILNECKRIRRERYPDGLPTGQAVATTAGHLPATWVIHTVGPVYSGSEDRSALLASCHTEALRVADELGAKSVAFPAISTGAFGYPVEEAAPVAVRAVGEAATRVELVRFVVFDRAAYEAFERALQGG